MHECCGNDWHLIFNLPLRTLSWALKTVSQYLERNMVIWTRPVVDKATVSNGTIRRPLKQKKIKTFKPKMKIMPRFFFSKLRVFVHKKFVSLMLCTTFMFSEDWFIDVVNIISNSLLNKLSTWIHKMRWILVMTFLPPQSEGNKMLTGI